MGMLALNINIGEESAVREPIICYQVVLKSIVCVWYCEWLDLSLLSGKIVRCKQPAAFLFVYLTTYRVQYNLQPIFLTQRFKTLSKQL